MAANVVEQATILRSGLDASGYVEGARKIEAANAAIKGSTDAAAAAGERATKVTEDTSRAYERLRLRLDPAAKAMADYERAENLVTRARERGLASQADADRVIDLARARMERFGKGAEEAGGRFRNFGALAGNAGYQIQDAAVQIQMGTSALVVAGQQGSQFLGAFGAGGAVAGAALALGAIALQLAGVKTEQERLTESLEKAEGVWRGAHDAAERYRSGLADEAEKVKQLAVYYNQLSGAQQAVERIKLERTRSELSEREAALKGGVAGRGLGGRLDASEGVLDPVAGGLGGEFSVLSGAGGRAPVPEGLRASIELMRQFRDEQGLTVEGASRLIEKLTLQAKAGGENAREILAQRDALVEALPQIAELERAQERAAAQATALEGATRGAGAGAAAMAGAFAAAKGPLEELVQAARAAEAELSALQEGGAEGLAEFRRAADLDREARAAREKQRKAFRDQGYNPADAGRLTQAGEADRLAELARRQRAVEGRGAEEAVQRAAEQRRIAERVRAAPEADRTRVAAEIRAEAEARRLNMTEAQREKYVADQVAAALANQTEKRKAKTDAEKAAEKEARRLARAEADVLEVEERAATEAAVAEAARQGPAAEKAAELNGRIREGTAEWRAYRDAVSDPELKKHWDELIERYERAARAGAASADAARDNRRLASMDREIGRQREEAGLVFLPRTERAAKQAILDEKYRMKDEGWSDEEVEGQAGEDRMTKAAEIALGDDKLRRLEEMKYAAQGFGAALTDAFEGAVLRGEDLGDVVDNLEKSILQIMTKVLVQKPLEEALSGIMGSMGGAAGGAGGGGMWASIISGVASLFHEGGVAGDPAAPRVVVPLDAYRHAPRFHGGGQAGVRHFASDEVPAVLRKKELVLTEGQQASVARAIAGGGGGARQRPAIAFNQTIVAKDADTFRANRNQVGADMQRGLARAARNM